MILDSSVLVHIMLGEAGWETTIRWLSEQPRLRLSAVSLVEIHAVVRGRSRQPLIYDLSELLARLEIEIVAFDVQQARLAQDAYLRYGRGQGHPGTAQFR